jgi:hypothetical protein
MFKPDPGGPLHFKLGDQGAGYVPYWQIKPGQGFTCFATAVT